MHQWILEGLPTQIKSQHIRYLKEDKLLIYCQLCYVRIKLLIEESRRKDLLLRTYAHQRGFKSVSKPLQTTFTYNKGIEVSIHNKQKNPSPRAKKDPIFPDAPKFSLKAEKLLSDQKHESNGNKIIKCKDCGRSMEVYVLSSRQYCDICKNKFSFRKTRENQSIPQPKLS